MACEIASIGRGTIEFGRSSKVVCELALRAKTAWKGRLTEGQMRPSYMTMNSGVEPPVISQR